MSEAIWDRPIILCNITAIKTITIVVIMCDLFRWKLIYCLFISVLSFENQLSEGKVGITLTDLTHHIFVCRKPGSEFPTSSNVVVFFMFNEK